MLIGHMEIIRNVCISLFRLKNPQLKSLIEVILRMKYSDTIRSIFREKVRSVITCLKACITFVQEAQISVLKGVDACFLGLTPQGCSVYSSFILSDVSISM